MKKNNATHSQIELLRKASKNIIASQSKPNVPASFSIICSWDDKSASDLSIAVKDIRVAEFDALLDSALDAKPHSITVKVYSGKGAEVYEVPGGTNTVRIIENKRPVKQIGKIPAAQNPFTETAVQQPASGNKYDSDYILDMEKRMQEKLEQQHQNFLRERESEKKDERIQELEAENDDLNKAIEEYEAKIHELEAEVETGKKTFHANAEGVIKAAMSAAATNPDGKFLGFIPNQVLAGIFGGGSSPQGQIAGAATEYNHAEIPVIVDYLNGRSEADFEAIYQIFSLMASNPENIAKINQIIAPPASK